MKKIFFAAVALFFIISVFLFVFLEYQGRKLVFPNVYYKGEKMVYGLVFNDTLGRSVFTGVVSDFSLGADQAGLTLASTQNSKIKISFDPGSTMITLNTDERQSEFLWRIFEPNELSQSLQRNTPVTVLFFDENINIKPEMRKEDYSRINIVIHKYD